MLPNVSFYFINTGKLILNLQRKRTLFELLHATNDNLSNSITQSSKCQISHGDIIIILIISNYYFTSLNISQIIILLHLLAPFIAAKFTGETTK